MKKLIIGLMVLFLPLAPVSCINSPILDGTRWSLIEINGSEIIEGTHISLYFDDGTASGIQTKSRLEELGLHDIVGDLEQRGLAV